MTETGTARSDTPDLIMFCARKINESLECYKVGRMGCNKITPNFLGIAKNGLEIYSYTVGFEDGTSKEITDTHAVYSRGDEYTKSDAWLANTPQAKHDLHVFDDLEWVETQDDRYEYTKSNAC